MDWIRRIISLFVGAGNLGQALANNQDFDSNGFKIIGLFDVNPRLIGMTVRGVEVYDIDMLETFLKEHEVMIAALTLPEVEGNEGCRTVS